MVVPSAIALTLFLFLVGVISVIVYLRGRRRITALPPGKIVCGDLQSKGTVLKSLRYRVSGKPDMVVRNGNSVIPYEYKSSRASVPRGGHLLQMAAYFLILEENHPDLGVPYGVIKYQDSAFRVRNTMKLRSDLLHAMEEMRHTYDMPYRKHSNPRRCAGCSFRQTCPQSLINYEGWQENPHEYRYS